MPALRRSPDSFRRYAPALYAAVATADVLLAGSPSPARRRLRVLTKPLLMPALATAFADATNGSSTSSTLRAGTLGAQLMSWGGDVALMSTGKRSFLAGLGSFGGAHVAYTTGFLSAGRSLTDRTHTEGVRSAALLFAGLAPVMGWAAGRRDPALRGPVIGYAAILTSMFAASSRLDARLPDPAQRTVMAGTTLFLASDTILGVRKFVMTNPGPRSDAAVMATYTLGQGLIARGVAQALA